MEGCASGTLSNVPAPSPVLGTEWTLNMCLFNDCTKERTFLDTSKNTTSLGSILHLRLPPFSLLGPVGIRPSWASPGVKPHSLLSTSRALSLQPRTHWHSEWRSAEPGTCPDVCDQPSASRADPPESGSSRCSVHLGVGRRDESVSKQGFGPRVEVVLGKGVWDASGRGGPAWLPSPLPFDPGSRSHPADTLGGPLLNPGLPPSVDRSPTPTRGPCLHPHPNFPPRRPRRGGGPENGARTLSTPRVICSFRPPLGG